MKPVLIIDDSAWIAKTIKEALESGGYQVVDLAKDGLEGVDLYAKHLKKTHFVDESVTEH